LLVHAPPGVSQQALDATVQALTSGGWRVEEAVRVDFRISQTNVRYFRPRDAEMAKRVAEAVSGVARDFTDYRPRPEALIIEIWLEG
jgi:hypothetical protein